MKLLFIDACIRGEKSRTRKICVEIIQSLRAKYGSMVEEVVDLKTLNIGALYEADLEKRDKLIAEGDYSAFNLAKQFASADIIVVGAPYWDLSFPAVLKNYIENVAVNNIALHYTERGQEGLCKAKKAYYVSTSGGFMAGADFGYEYIKGVFGLFGIKDVESITAEGLDIIGTDVEAVVGEAVKKAKEI